MTAQTKKPVRCAIYTRKSTEHGLELEFNSLDAQREACEAYVKSQAHEGWTALPARYEDAAYSAGNLDRPALQRLLKDIDIGKVDVIVVYKIDRLTRSLADFAKLVEIFDAKSISFVAITQQFNTTTSMGRLTLNVLLSFAQFERELSSERVRDKIAASRRKGKWTGGSVPLGYDAKDKKLIINESQAKNVRYMFKRYLELGTIKLLEKDLALKGIRSNGRVDSKKQTAAGVPWTFGPLAYLLRNRIYVGEIGHKGKWFPAEHEPIVERVIFDQVQQRLNSNSVNRKLRRTASGALLAGLLFDDIGNRMSPSFSTKRGIRYGFYVSSALLRGNKDRTGTVGRVSAPAIEAAVIEAAKEHTQHSDTKMMDRALVQSHVARVEVSRAHLRIEFARGDSRGSTADPENTEQTEPSYVVLPWSPGSAHPLVSVDERATVNKGKPNPILVQAFARAHTWVQRLTDGSYSTIKELAKANDIHPKVIRVSIRLAFLSPELTAAALNGTQTPTPKLAALQDASALLWSEQINRFNGYFLCLSNNF
jgi:site-specific DNA recombinase